MDNREQHLLNLRVAEHQFRLACTVHLAVANGVQTLDVPVEWVFGRHRVSYEDFGLRPDQADYAALQLELTATFVIAGVIRDALVDLFDNPKTHQNPDVVAAYQISRMIRNAFAHWMLYPRWSIDEDCRDRTFTVGDVISLNTTGLSNRVLDWRHYGGPLAMFHFGRFVREVLLGDRVDPNRRKPPFPTIECYQQGRLIARRLDDLPTGLTEVARAGPGESIDLGAGHKIYVPSETEG
jgi:hypothetical protein